MSIMVFLLISIIVHAIPLSLSRQMFQFRMLMRWLPLRVIWGFFAWVIATLFLQLTLPWAVLFLIPSISLLFLVSSGLRPQNIKYMIEQGRSPIICLAFIFLMVTPAFAGVISWTSDVSNAESFDGLIVETNEPLFSDPIPDNMVRLVTSQYANFVASQYLATIGSEVEISASHITTKDGRLVWVCVVVPTNVLAENQIKALIVVDANNPSQVEVITDVSLPVGEGLFWDKAIRFGNYLNDMTQAYEYSYPTWSPNGNLVYIQTRTVLGWDFVERPLGPKLYFENGTVVSYPSVEETPDWITQAYSEEWLERQIGRWGGYRRGEGFDLFAGGFLWTIPPSNDRLEMTEDTRYIVNPSTSRVEGFVAVNPPSASDLTLSGVFRATSDGIFLHDLREEGFISGVAAVNEIIKSLPEVSSGNYFGAMPLIYPVEINETETRYAWYCPIYWADGYYDDDEWRISDIRLHALALVDAAEETKSYLHRSGGSTIGEGLVKTAREGYIEAMGGAVEEESQGIFNLTASVLNKTEYVQDGDTHTVLGTSNSTYAWIEGTKDWMDLNSWYALLNADVGDSFVATINIVGEQYRITAFSVE